jgi:hypothetical protein
MAFLPEHQALLPAFLDGLQKLRMLRSRLAGSTIYAINKSTMGILRALMEQSNRSDRSQAA